MGKCNQRRGLICAITVLVALSSMAEAACRDDAVQVKGGWGQAQFTVDVADEPAERSQGLMHVESMAQSAGMLFVYEEPQPARFWMKNTLISLDMIFADETGTVQKVHENAEPLSERLINGGRDIQYVLEVNGGVAGRFGIGPGDQLRHPAIEQGAAAWPCE
ncbi:MAG: DUF192 domain-containing protein [Pseudomonadota bacterium]